MTRKMLPAFLPLMLALCLVIGMLGNLTHFTGAAVVIVTVLALFSIYLLAPQVERWPMRKLQIGIIAGLVAMLIAQIVLLATMPVSVYHDPYRVLAQADQMAAGNFAWHTTYFWRYANNVPLTYLLSLWLRLGHVVGLSTNLAIHALSILILDSFIGLMLVTIWQLAHRKALLLGAFAFFALTPFAYTYYLQVFYSDLPSMLLLLLIFRVFWRWPHHNRRQRICEGVGLVVAVVLGALIKANLIVLLPAVAIIAVLLWHKHLLRSLKLAVPIVLVIAGFGLSVPATHAIDSLSHYTPNTAFAFPTSNWVLMGLNANTAGKYSPADVHQAIKLPNQAARQQSDTKLIPKRLKHLGVFGLVRLWLAKLRVLMHVNSIQDWYNGGFRQAPGWYQQHASSLRALTMISYTAATWGLWVILILRLIAWRPDWTQPQTVAAMLAIVTALGYLAFHTLLWEAETRYGQIILPLLWLALAALPAPVRTKLAVKTPWLPAAFVALSGVALIGSSLAVANNHLQNNVVAAQRSQLSTQYRAKPAQISPNTVLSQDVTLNGSTNYFSVQIHTQSQVRVTLVNRATDHTYRLQATGQVYRLRRDLPAGRYRIVVVNNTATHQAVDIVATRHYRLSASPLIINGQAKPTSAFIYKFFDYGSRRSHG
ncbi:hypothetical protein [Lacticaseibacillus sp. GG6-2]